MYISHFNEEKLVNVLLSLFSVDKRFKCVFLEVHYSAFSLREWRLECFLGLFYINSF